MVAAEERTKRRRRSLLAGVRARRWVSAPPSSSPWMAPCFRARAHAPRRPRGERRLSVLGSGKLRRSPVPRIGSVGHGEETGKAPPAPFTSRVRV